MGAGIVKELRELLALGLCRWSLRKELFGLFVGHDDFQVADARFSYSRCLPLDFDHCFTDD